MKVFRIIGNEGRITIPYSIRQAVGFLPDDVVSFQIMDADSVLVRREALCEKEKTASVSKPDTNLIEYLESLSPKEQFTALARDLSRIFLSQCLLMAFFSVSNKLLARKRLVKLSFL